MATPSGTHTHTHTHSPPPPPPQDPSAAVAGGGDRVAAFKRYIADLERRGGGKVRAGRVGGRGEGAVQVCGCGRKDGQKPQ